MTTGSTSTKNMHQSSQFMHVEQSCKMENQSKF